MKKIKSEYVARRRGEEFKTTGMQDVIGEGRVLEEGISRGHDSRLSPISCHLSGVLVLQIGHEMQESPRQAAVFDATQHYTYFVQPC